MANPAIVTEATATAPAPDAAAIATPAAEAHATTEAHAGAEEHVTPSALGFDASMLVALAMLAVIALALWKKVPAMIAGALDSQIAGIRAQLDQATALRAEAEAIKAEYEAKAKQAAIDAEAMKAAAEEEAKLIISRAKSDATALIGRRAQAAEDKIAAVPRVGIAYAQEHALLPWRFFIKGNKYFSKPKKT